MLLLLADWAQETGEDKREVGLWGGLEDQEACEQHNDMRTGGPIQPPRVSLPSAGRRQDAGRVPAPELS